jgi:peptide/nickel transport system permease protein
MRAFIIRRVLQAIPLLFGISLVCFMIIQLPPGDFLTSYVNNLRAQGEYLDQAQIDALEARYGLDKPVYVQYLKWITNFLQGDMGYSFYWERPVNQLIGERIVLSMTISILTFIVTYVVAIPVGILSAVKQYTVVDHVLTFLAFIAVGLPGFLLALILMYIGVKYLGMKAGGLFSEQYMDAAWSMAKVVDLLKHIWLPVLIIGLSRTAWTIRTMRAMTLDELGRPYVEAARARGLSETTTILRYPVRVALNPLISTVGWRLRDIINGEVLVSIVLGLATTGPLLNRALLTQDVYLAASFIMILCSVVVFGSLLSDILLAWVDPRIRFGGGGQ